MAAPQRRRQRSKEGAAPACRRLFDGQVAAHVEEICIRQDRMLAGPGAKYPKAVCRGPVTQMTLHAQRHRHGHHDAQHRVAVQVGHAARASPSHRGKILPPLDEARLVWRQRLQQKVGKSPRLIGANDDFTELSGCVRGRNDEKDKVRREFEKKCLNDWSESSPRPVKNDVALQTFKPLRDQLRRVNPHIDQILAVHQIEKSDAVPPKSTERLSNARIESQKPSCDFFRSEPDGNEPLPHRSISPVLPIASEAPAQPHPTKAPAMAHSSPKPACGNVLDCGADADAGTEGDIFATVKRLVEDGVKKNRAREKPEANSKSTRADILPTRKRVIAAFDAMLENYRQQAVAEIFGESPPRNEPAPKKEPPREPIFPWESQTFVS